MILIDAFIAYSAIVVRRPGARRQRIPFQQDAGNRIDPIRGDDVARELTAYHARRSWNRRVGIVNKRDPSGDRFGEPTLTLQQRRDRGDHRAADRLPLSLIVGEEERPIVANRTAENAPSSCVAATMRWRSSSRPR